MTVRFRRPSAAPLLAFAGSYALAFAQRPGLLTADTKINLHVAPGRFLHQAAAMWSATGQLGGVQAGQQAGYLFPMGPFFAAGHALGLPDWVLQRLWLGSLLAATCLGMIALLRALSERPPVVAQLAAAAVAVLNPFVVTYTNRTTVSLLALAVLPWLLLAVHRGLREPGRWRWPALVALLVTVSGPGVNAAVTGWMLLGPVLLAGYELATDPALRGRRALRFAARTLGLTVLVSVWWAIPAAVQSAYGNDFLRFTEQPGTVWGTTSATETLRLMGFWLSYVGIGFGGPAIPYFSDSATLLFSPAVVAATLLLPAVAFGGFVWTRRWRYGPFFVLLAIVAVLVVGAGYPEGTPLRHGLYFLYNHVAALQFLRTSYKAAPLLVVSIAMLIAAGVGRGWPALGGGVRRTAVVLAGAAVMALAGWPLVTGRAQDTQVSLRAVPAAWRSVAADLRTLPDSSRAVVIPGALFAFYRWGGTVDPILPALTDRPVAERTEVPYADPHATDLLWEINDLVAQRRLLPGQLAPLLSLIGASAVITPTDSDRRRSDAPPPADVSAELAAQAGFARPARSYGPDRSFARTDAPAAALTLPEVRRYALTGGRPGVRLEPRANPLVVDGSAATLAALAAFGELTPGRAIRYAGDLAPAGLRSELTGGGELVIGDSNRRRALVAATIEQNAGPVLSARDSVSADGVILDPFGRGPNAQTVASYGAVADVHSPASPQRPQFPEHGAVAAIDGDPSTFWLADGDLDPTRHWLEVDFSARQSVPYVDLWAYGPVRSVAIAGRGFALRPGWNRLALRLHATEAVRVTLAAAGPGPVGIRELRFPGLRATPALRLPRDGAEALLGRDLSRLTLEYVFERVTGDEPFLRGSVPAADPQDVARPGDGEQLLSRQLLVPARRRFTARAWVSAAAAAPDPALDRLAGQRGPVRAWSSSRAAGLPAYRASRALDGRAATAWIGDWRPGGATWIAWRAPRPGRLLTLHLVVPALPVRRPSVVELAWPGGRSGPLAVDSGGTVRLPRPVRTRALRLTVLSATAPAGATAAERGAVGIAEISGAGVPRLPPAPADRRLSAPCGAVRVDVSGTVVGLRVSGTVAELDAGTPLAARSCTPPLPLAAGEQSLRSLAGPLLVDELSLRSEALRAAGSGRPGTLGPHLRPDGTGVWATVRIRAPSWIVLGQGFSRGWRASCGGRSLGTPAPIDGYANGWPIGPACHLVRFSFAPQRAADVGYVLSLLGALLCLTLCVGSRGVAATRRRPAWRSVDPRPARLSARRALAWALPLAAAFSFTFGLRTGAVALPLMALVLWRGIGDARLAALAGALLAVPVPLLYLLNPGDSDGGSHAGYAAAHMSAHWLGVAAIGLVLVAAVRATPRSGP